MCYSRRRLGSSRSRQGRDWGERTGGEGTGEGDWGLGGEDWGRGLGEGDWGRGLREGDWGDDQPPPPVVLKSDFEIFLNLMGNVGDGGGGKLLL